MSLATSIKSKGTCRWDAVALGEVMLRLDPGENRVRNAPSFQPWECGGEYNVIRGLRTCFNYSTALVTALVDNEIGQLIASLIQQGGVTPEYIRWVATDGIGRSVRNGLNFTERGFGLRAPLGTVDRGHSAASQLKKGDVDWNKLFKIEGVRWFHSGGIFAALSASTAALLIEGLTEAGANKTVRSFDFNYRPSLWQAMGKEINIKDQYTQILKNVEVVFGSPFDFEKALGLKVSAASTDESAAFSEIAQQVTKSFPNIKLIATTVRDATSASSHSMKGLAFTDGTTVETAALTDIAVLDRIGSGDSFASGVIFGVMENLSIINCLQLGLAHAALTMTTPGDSSFVSRAEVEELAYKGKLGMKR